MESFGLLPLWYQYSLVALFGAIIASFANVVAYRLHTNVSLNGRSRCFSCGQTLRWYELLPIVSYLAQRGRCRQCRAQIPRRDLWVELLMAGLFLSAFILAASLVQLLVWWLLLTVLLIITLYDLEHFIIPNELVMLIAAVAVGMYSVSQWPLTLEAVGVVGLSVLTAAGLYAALWWYSGGTWLGFGDVKLAAALGPLLSIEQAFGMVVLSFWIGAMVGVLWIFVPRWWSLVRGEGRVQSATLKSEIPFAPFIAAAFLVVYIYGVDVFSLFVIT